MKKLIFALLVGGYVCAAQAADPFVASSSTAVTADCVAPETAVVLPERTNSAFDAGETLTFVIKYQFVSGGNATLQVQQGPKIHCRPTLQLTSSARSNGFVDKIFKVRDFNSSTIDERSLASVAFHQNLEEGHYHVVRNTTVDYFRRSYKYEREYKGNKGGSDGKLDEPVNDILSAFFYTRTLPLKPGNDYQIRVFSDPSIYSLKIKVYPDIDTIKVGAGRFECLRVEPFIIGDTNLKSKKRKITILLTNDSRRMPVLIRSKVLIGAFDAELISYKTGTRSLPDDTQE